MTTALPYTPEPLSTVPCPGCRGDVYLSLDEIGNAGVFRPLGVALVKGEQRMEQQVVFVRHNCPELTAWRRMLAEERKDEAERRSSSAKEVRNQERRLRKEANMAMQDDQWEIAVTISCPKCSVEVGERCVNLMERRRNLVKHTNWPHPERFISAMEQREEKH